MKNLHVLPTDKRSILSDCENYKHVYITSDEEIKEGDWFIMSGFILRKCDYVDNYMIIDTTQGKHFFSVCKKIILTTDQDLIADGIQAIDDIFLEWFVKNPSCEEVKIEDYGTLYNFRYLILIPQEEPKQETLDFISKELDIERKRVHKQETLEEAALRLYPKFSHDPYNPLEDVLEDEREIFIEGAEWQAERMYSDIEVFTEELKNKIDSFEYSVNQNSYISDYIKEWFEQFKKKGGDK